MTREQKSVLAMCVTLYTAAYICRLNLSAALGGVMEDLQLTMARGGMLQTVFAAIYAAGQFVNGSVVDRVNPARYMLLGLAGSAACNIAMGFAGSYGALLVLWSLNAAFQSMLWTPVMRLLALYFRESEMRVLANEIVALMLIVGHLIAWAISGFMSVRAGWRLSFVIPGMLALAAIACMAKTALTLDIAGRQAQAARETISGGPIMRVMASTGFFLVLVTCVLYGFIRDSVITWTPTILARLSSGGTLSATAFMLVLPALNMAGVKLGFVLRRRGAMPYGVVTVMMLAAVVCAALLMPGQKLAAASVLLGLICAGMYGANTMLTGLIPLEYDRIGRTSLTAGLIDSLIYLGSALSGALAGGVYETLGGRALYALWMAAGVASALLMTASAGMSARYWKANGR